MRAAFLYLYPIPEYVDACLERAGRLMVREITAAVFKRFNLTDKKYSRLLEKDPSKASFVKRVHQAYTSQIVTQRMTGRLECAIHDRYRAQGYDVGLFSKVTPAQKLCPLSHMTVLQVWILILRLILQLCPIDSIVILICIRH